jgi:hypothetical protein
MKFLTDGNGVSPEIIVKLRLPLRLPWAVPPEDVRILGTVHRGMEYGFLGKTALGEYVQVNGSTLQPLDAAMVEQALRDAADGPRPPSGGIRSQVRPVAPAPSVVTIRKKRRILVPA